MRAPPDALLDALARESELARELAGLIESESSGFATASPERIEALAVRKAELARQAAAAGRNRDDALAAAGLPRGLHGLELACTRGGPAWRGHLDVLLASARQARRMNERMGALVDQRLRHVSGALGVLLRAAPEAAPVYSSDGMVHGGGLSRTRATV